MEDIEKYYKYIANVNEYSRESEISKKRLKEFEKIYEDNKDFFGHRILDLCCGGGIFSIFLAEKGHKVLGIDINKNMIDLANKYKPNQDNPVFIQGDVTKFKPDKDFDTIICMGGSLMHIPFKGFVDITKNIFQKTNKVLIESFDRIAYGFEGKLKYVMVQKRPEKGISFDFYDKYDPDEGAMLKTCLYIGEDGRIETFDFKVYLYGPFVVEALMYSAGFELKKRLKPEHGVYIDFYEKTSI